MLYTIEGQLINNKDNIDKYLNLINNPINLNIKKIPLNNNNKVTILNKNKLCDGSCTQDQIIEQNIKNTCNGYLYENNKQNCINDHKNNFYDLTGPYYAENIFKKNDFKNIK